MADQISNPGDRESLSRLLEGLKRLDANLTKQVTQSGEQTRAEIGRARSQAAREARARPVGPLGGAAEVTTQQTARSAEQLRIEKEIQRAVDATRRARQQEVRESRDLLSAVQRVKQASTPVTKASTLLQRPVGAQRPLTPDELLAAAKRVQAAQPPPPPPPPPPTTYAPPPEDDARRRGISLSEVIGGQRRTAVHEDPLAKLSPHDAEAYQRALGGAGRSVDDLERELQRLTRTQALAGDQMRRHGLLTTEFLAAAADGRTTVSELGVQIGGTIAKFGGWTAAASATYGALAAVQQLGQGAVDSVNGVTSLQRVIGNVDTEKAQEQFRSLAQQFNLPISQVTAASYESAKAFHTQADAIVATRAALYGVKIGEIDAGDAARYVTAIYRGFHLSVGELGDVIDVVNQQQQRFGTDFKSTAQGIAGAAGSFGAAGGTYRELAALIGTGELVTGRTGPEIGTVLRRTAELSRRPERRQSIIDLLGLDPKDTSVTKLIERGMEKVKAGADVGVVARTLTTPELASRGLIAILRAQAQYRTALREAQPDRSHGSAQKELETALTGVNEKAKELGVNLQRLGSSLAQSGALDGAVLLLDTLNLTLKTTTDLIGLFNQLPRPLRQGLLIAAQFAGTLAVLRRFNVGQVFAQGGVLNRTLSRDPERLSRAGVIQGLRDETSFVVSERERATTTAARATYNAGQQRGRVANLLAIDDGSEAHAKEIARAQRRLEQFEEQAANAVEDQADLAQRHRDIVTRENEFRRRTTRRGGEAVQAVGRDLGIFYGSEIQPRPNANEPFPIIGGPGEDAGRQSRLRDQVTTEYQRVNREMQAVGRSRAFTSGAASLAAGTAAARGVATGARNLAGALAASIGPLEGGILGLLVVFETYQQIKGQMADSAARLRAIDSATGLDDLNAAAREIKAQAAGPGGLQGALEDVQDVYADVFNTIAKGLGGPSAPQISSPQQIREAAGRNAQRTIDTIRQANQHGVALTRGQIEEHFRQSLQQGDDPNAALQQALRSADSARGLIYAQNPEALKRAQEDIQTFKERLRLYRKTIGDVDKTYGEGLNLAQLDPVNKVRIFTRGADPTVVRATGAAIAKAREELATTNDPAQQSQIIAQIQQAQQTVENELTTQFQRRLALSTGPQQSGRLRSQYLTQMRKLTVDPLKKQVDDAAGGAKDAQRELDRLTQAGAAGDPEIRSLQGPGRATALRNRQERIKQLRAQIADGDGRAKRLRQQLKREKEQYDLLDQEQSKAQFQDRQQLFAARTSRLQSETADPVAQARIAVTRGRVRLSAIREAFKRGDAAQTDLENAIAEQNRNIQQLAQAQLSHFQAAQGLSTAQFNLSHLGDQGSTLSHAVGQAQQFATFVAGQGKKLGPDELLNAQRSVVEARSAYAEYLFQQAQDMVSARAELAQAQTDDPVKLAAIKVREAQQLQGYARTPADRIRAQAAVLSAQRDKQNAVYHAQLDTINFDADIGRIDKDVQIRRLQGLLRTIKGNQDLRRQIRRQIYQLKQEVDGTQDVSLDVGSIKLPTTYEIRRAIKGGLDSGRQVQVTNHLGGVVVQGGDPDKVVDRIQQAFGTSTTAAMRSATL